MRGNGVSQCEAPPIGHTSIDAFIWSDADEPRAPHRKSCQQSRKRIHFSGQFFSMNSNLQVCDRKQNYAEQTITMRTMNT